MCGGIAAFDYDNDGDIDLFFTNGARFPDLKKSDSTFFNSLLKNRSDGTFEDATLQAGLTGADLDYNFGVAAADYNNDGFTDLFVAGSKRDVLYKNNRNGTFTDVTKGSGLDLRPVNTLSVAGAWVDYDSDGLLDLVVSTYTFWTPESDIRCIKPTGDYYCHPATYKSIAQVLYKNLGDGKFLNVTEKSGLATSLGKGMGIGIADFDDDGFQDIFIANDTVRNFLFMNQKNGTFKEGALVYGVAYNDEAATVSGMGCDVKDFNNDGWVDVFYNDLAGQIFALFQNEGGKFFKYISPTHNIERLSRLYSGWGAGFIDYNNDGWKDIYNANGDIEYEGENKRQNDTMFENQRGRTFTDVSEKLGRDFMFKGFQRGSAFADLNNDGFLDIIVTSLFERPRILINSASNSNNWLVLHLEGQNSNRDAIGTKVKVTTTSGMTLYNHVSTSIGFISSSDKRLHFGLGSDKIRSVEIRWPGGRAFSLGNLAVNQIHKIKEPSK
jgi:enediyne biosynthesis protein E4